MTFRDTLADLLGDGDYTPKGFRVARNLMDTQDKIIAENIESIATLLQCSKEDIIVTTQVGGESKDYRPTSLSDLRDRIVKQIPLYNYAVINQIGDTNYLGTYSGITLISTQRMSFKVGSVEEAYEPILYCSVSITNGYNVLTCFVYNKNTVGKLARYYNLLEKYDRKRTVISKPILCEGLLEDIVDKATRVLFKKTQIEFLGGSVQTGIIFSGEPGNGKTLTCRLIEKMVAERGFEVRKYTNSAVQQAIQQDELNYLMNVPGLQLYDDLDISFFIRNGDGANSQIATSMLSAMDGVSEKQSCIRIFSTNEIISDIDPAFLRPGRIDHIFHFPKPTARERKLYIESWKESVRNMVPDIKELVAQTKDFSFAEINIIREALINSIINKNNVSIDKLLEEISNRPKNQAVKKKVGFG